MDTNILYTSLLGGLLVGIAAVLLMFTLGRITGVSGIVSGLLTFKLDKSESWRIAFVLGLVVGPVLYALTGGTLPEITIDSRLPHIIIAGLLVGFGSTLGSGCASGHGVCGLARISPRSILATGLFVASAMLTVYLTK